jgi:hypothetical protein
MPTPTIPSWRRQTSPTSQRQFPQHATRSRRLYFELLFSGNGIDDRYLGASCLMPSFGTSWISAGFWVLLGALVMPFSILLVEALSPNTRRSSRDISVALQFVT